MKSEPNHVIVQDILFFLESTCTGYDEKGHEPRDPYCWLIA